MAAPTPPEPVHLDEHLAELVPALWALGVETVWSCQGGPTEVAHIDVTARTAELADVVFTWRDYLVALAAAGWAIDMTVSETLAALDAIPGGVDVPHEAYDHVVNAGTTIARRFLFHPAAIDSLTYAAGQLAAVDHDGWAALTAEFDGHKAAAVWSVLHDAGLPAEAPEPGPDGVTP